MEGEARAEASCGLRRATAEGACEQRSLRGQTARLGVRAASLGEEKGNTPEDRQESWRAGREPARQGEQQVHGPEADGRPGVEAQDEAAEAV